VLATIEFVIIIVSVLFLIFYGWKNIPVTRLRWLFILSFLFTSFYKIFDPVSDSRSLLWERHIPVYIGQIWFYLFITEFSKKYIEIETAEVKDKGFVLKQNILVLLPIVAFVSGFSWFQYLTDEGLPHILTLPLFVVVFSLTRLRIAVYESTYIKAVRYFTAAAGALILIHVSEFIMESQKMFPSLDRFKGDFEFVWYLLGAFFYFIALRSYFRQLKTTKKSEGTARAATTV
jgi:hypothetical protein